MAKAKKIQTDAINTKKNGWTLGIAGGIIGALAAATLFTNKTKKNKSTAEFTFSPTATGSMELILNKKVIIIPAKSNFLYKGIFCLAVGALIGQLIKHK